MSSTAWLILTIVGALGSAACLYGIYGDKKRGYPALKAVDSQFEMPDMRFRYTPEELFACLEKLETEGRQRLRRLWGLDSALALFLVLVLAVVSHNLAAFRWLRCETGSRPCGHLRSNRSPSKSRKHTSPT